MKNKVLKNYTDQKCCPVVKVKPIRLGNETALVGS